VKGAHGESIVLALPDGKLFLEVLERVEFAGVRGCGQKVGQWRPLRRQGYIVLIRKKDHVFLHNPVSYSDI
jgi:hypothetical protein